jgi:hypothetical protein
MSKEIDKTTNKNKASKRLGGSNSADFEEIMKRIRPFVKKGNSVHPFTSTKGKWVDANVSNPTARAM